MRVSVLRKGRNDMNPVLIILILLGGALLWLLCSFLYRPIGKFFKKLIDEAKEAMSEDDNEKGGKEK